MSGDLFLIIYSPEAKDDLREIYSYIAYDLQAPETAKGQVDHIRKEIRSLDFMLSRYAVVDWEPWKSMGMHRIPVDNFLVYYAVNGRQPHGNCDPNFLRQQGCRGHHSGRT